MFILHSHSTAVMEVVLCDIQITPITVKAAPAPHTFLSLIRTTNYKRGYINNAGLYVMFICVRFVKDDSCRYVDANLTPSKLCYKHPPS